VQFLLIFQNLVAMQHPRPTPKTLLLTLSIFGYTELILAYFCLNSVAMATSFAP